MLWVTWDPSASALSAVAQCERGHDGAGWPLLGGDPDAVGALVRGECPICPGQRLDEVDHPAKITVGTCLCCGSTWRLAGSDLDSLPGDQAKVSGL